MAERLLWPHVRCAGASPPPQAHLRQVARVRRVEEGVAVAGEQRLVGMHPAAVHACQRLGHEGGVDAMLHRHLLDGDAVGHATVSHGQGVSVPQVDLVLAWRHLVVAVFDADPHLLEGEDGLAAEVRPAVDGKAVEITARIEDLGGAFIRKIEILEFGTHIEGVALLGGPGEHAFEDVSGVTLVGRAVRVQDVTEHPRHRPVAGTPGDQLKGRRVRPGDHVAFLDARESLDGRPVETHPLGQALFEFRRSHAEGFELAQDVCEPELDETDLFRFNELENILRCLARIHSCLLLLPFWAGSRPDADSLAGRISPP